MKYAVKFLLLFALVFSVSAFAEDRDDVYHRLDAAAADLDRLTNAPDRGIPQDILTGAKCIAIVPNLVKAGFIFGGEGGRGVATCRVDGDAAGARRHSSPSPAVAGEPRSESRAPTSSCSS